MGDRLEKSLRMSSWPHPTPLLSTRLDSALVVFSCVLDPTPASTVVTSQRAGRHVSRLILKMFIRRDVMFNSYKRMDAIGAYVFQDNRPGLAQLLVTDAKRGIGLDLLRADVENHGGQTSIPALSVTVTTSRFSA